MIVSEFIEWLKTQDQGATVEVIVTECSMYENWPEVREFTPELSCYMDLRDNPSAIGTPNEGRRTLLLGED